MIGLGSDKNTDIDEMSKFVSIYTTMGSSDLCYLYFNFLLTSSHIARLLLKAQ